MVSIYLSILIKRKIYYFKGENYMAKKVYCKDAIDRIYENINAEIRT